MTDTQKQTTKPWYNELQSKITELAERFELDPIQTNEFRESFLAVCKEQYMSGNRSGIAWMRRQLQEKTAGAQS